MYCAQCGTAFQLASRFCSSCGSPAGRTAPSASSAAAALEAPARVSAVVGWLLLAAGALFTVGSLLPWMKASTPFGTMERGALDGDGIITLIAGIVIVACGAAALARVGRQPAYWFGLLGAAIGGAVAAYDGTRFLRLMQAINADAEGVMAAEIGIGLVLVALAVLPALAGLCVLASRFVTPHMQDGRLVRPRLNSALQVLAVLVVLAAVASSAAVASQEKVELTASESGDDDEQEGEELTASSSAQLEELSSGTAPSSSSDASEEGLGADAASDGEDTEVAPPSEDSLYGSNGQSEVATSDPAEASNEQESAPEPEPAAVPAEPTGRSEQDETVVTGPGSVTADPYSGPAGAVITVSGAGWTPGAVVSITYSDPATGTTTNWETAKVDAEGGFTSTFTADDQGTAAGGRVITASAAGYEATTEYYVE